MTRSEELGARAAEFCLHRRIAFAGAACQRARHIFALCHGATPVATYDRALEAMWTGLCYDDLPVVASIFRPLTEVVEATCNDTLSPLWVAWLALATFEFPALLVSTRVPVGAMTQCSGLMLTLTGDIDHRLGWTGAPHEGRLAEAEWAAQEMCLSILAADPSSPEIPVDELVAAGAEVGRTVQDLALVLAEATGWNLHLPLD